MSRPTVLAHFHGGPFDGGSLPIREDDADELVALTTGPDGPVLSGPVAEDEDRAGRDLYRLSAEASGLQGDVEYAYVELLGAADDGSAGARGTGPGPAGPYGRPMIRTNFGASTTASEVVAGVDLTGRRAIVTGGASGIGLETARALAGAGAQVTLAVRDLGAGGAARDDVARTTGRDDVAVSHLDLADLTTIDAFVAAWEGPLHVLVANAGVMDTPQGTTAQGWETQFGTNHLGHFALAVGLHDALAAAGDARIVSVSSSGHAQSPVVFDDLFFAHREYTPGAAYGQSKTANSLFAVEATRRWAEDGITANALMPGGIWTPLQRHWSPERRAAAEEQARQAEEAGLFRMKTTEQGAATSVFLAASPEVAGIGGRYFEDCNEAAVVERLDGLHGVLPHALDPEDARRLWDVSLELLAAARA